MTERLCRRKFGISLNMFVEKRIIAQYCRDQWLQRTVYKSCQVHIWFITKMLGDSALDHRLVIYCTKFNDCAWTIYDIVEKDIAQVILFRILYIYRE